MLDFAKDCSLTHRASAFWSPAFFLSLWLVYLLAGCGEDSTTQQAERISAAPQAPDATLSGDRPNILLLVADDLGYSDLGVYGGEIATPTLDALADSGMLLTNFHVAPTCSPTRSMLLTGVDHHLAGLGNMGELLAENQRGQPGYEGHLNDRVVSVARLLRDSGYHTYMAGKWHLGADQGYLPSDRGFGRSFAMLEGSGGHFDDAGLLPFSSTHYVSDGRPIARPEGFSTDLYTDKLLEFMRADQGDGRPFFAYAAYTAPHWPLQAPQEYIEQYKDRYSKGWGQLRAQRFKRMQEIGLIPPGLELPPRWPGVPAWSSLSSERQRVESRKMAVYAAMVANLDDNIARLLAYLRSENQLENTLVVFMSDNGADAANMESRPPAGLSSLQLFGYRAWLWLQYDNSLDNLGTASSWFSYAEPWAQVGSTPFFLHKGVVSEGGVRAPLIVSHPGTVPTATRSNALVSVKDLAPTFLDLASIEHPVDQYRGRDIHPIEGRSLLPLIAGGGEDFYGDNISLGFEFIGNRAFIQGDWKIYQIQPPASSGEWQLFNLRDDPRELVDLAQQYPVRLAEMVAQYQVYAREKGVIELPPDYFDNW